MSNRCYVATRKGLFTVDRGPSKWSVSHAAFVGDNVTLTTHDPRNGDLFAALNHGHFGIKLHRSRDGGETWPEIAVPAYPPMPEDVKNPVGDQSVAATSALILGLAEKTLERLAQGALDRVLIEGEQGAIGVYPCTADAALAVLITKNARLGLALTAARRTAAEIQSILNTIGQ